MPGITNKVVDATSRHPSQSSHAKDKSSNMFSVNDKNEKALNEAIMAETSQLTCIPWETIASETNGDKILREVLAHVKSGFPPECSILQPHIKPLWSVREALHIADQDVLMYGDRVFIPSSLQGAVLKILHYAHQGVSSMCSRAQSLLYWPGN